MQPAWEATVGTSSEFSENEIARIVVDASYQIHQRLGPGLLESVYEIILAYELRKRGLYVERQVPVEIVWVIYASKKDFART